MRKQRLTSKNLIYPKGKWQSDQTGFIESGLIAFLKRFALRFFMVTDILNKNKFVSLKNTPWILYRISVGFPQRKEMTLMSVKTYVSNKMTVLVNGIRRFAFPFAYTTLLFLVASYTIIKETNTEPLTRIILALSFGFFASILLTLLVERFAIKINVYLFQSLSVVATIGCWYFVKNFDSDAYIAMGYFGVTFAVVACIIFFLYNEDNKDLLAPHLLKGFVFSGAVAAILQGGLTLCIVAFNAIIMEIPEMWKYLGILGVFTGVLVAVNLFLSGVPKSGEVIVLPKVVKILLGTIGLPIYLLLLTILYLYLGKILITWNIPSNEINIYASFAALFFILFYFTLGSFRTENKMIDLFMKWGKYALIPIILVQLYAINIRVSAYGITSLRYVSIILVSIVLVFLLLAIIKKGKYLKVVFAVIAAVAIIFTFTPLNVIDVPDQIQYNRLVGYLEANDMYQDGAVIAKKDIPMKDKGEITNIFEYLVNSGGNNIELVKSFRDKAGYRGYDSEDFRSMFGFLPYHVGQVDPSQPESTYFSTTFIYTGLDVNDYSRYISNVGNMSSKQGVEPTKITKSNKTMEVVNETGETFTVDMFDVMETISAMGESANGALQQEMRVPVKGGDYFILMINFTQEGDTYSVEAANGFVLLK